MDTPKRKSETLATLTPYGPYRAIGPKQFQFPCLQGTGRVQNRSDRKLDQFP